MESRQSNERVLVGWRETFATPRGGHEVTEKMIDILFGYSVVALERNRVLPKMEACYCSCDRSTEVKKSELSG